MTIIENECLDIMGNMNKIDIQIKSSVYLDDRATGEGTDDTYRKIESTITN